MEEMEQRISMVLCLELWKNGGMKKVIVSETRSVSSCLAMESSRAGTIRRVSTTLGMDVVSRCPYPSNVVALVMPALAETTHLLVVLVRLLQMLQEAALLGVWSADSWAASVQYS